MNTAQVKALMIQGTASAVGKSLLTTAFCRIFKEDGFRVAPFKAQNMALNSYVTLEGLEMGRAQAVQAEASGILPAVEMNPILLKPSAGQNMQVILRGKVYQNMKAAEYAALKPQLKKIVAEAYQSLAQRVELLVLEGAGSPAEINIDGDDLVNMGLAEMTDAPVLLVGDIDKGGVFASLYGTMMLLKEKERKRVKGLLINKFRGDVEMLKPGLQKLEELLQIPVLGVIPYLAMEIEDEDSVSEEFRRPVEGNRDIQIEILWLPHLSNFTDFKVLRSFPDVSLRYIMEGDKIGNPDLLIIPGSKNTLQDLLYLQECGLAKQIQAHRQKGTPLMGICGGYQMMGRELKDPEETESGLKSVAGLNILGIDTVFAREKTTTQVVAKVSSLLPLPCQGMEDLIIRGYEIHMGQTIYRAGNQAFLQITESNGQQMNSKDGAVSGDGMAWGTYLHGIFDNVEFTRRLLNSLRKKKGLSPLEGLPCSYQLQKEREYSRLAAIVRQNVDMSWIYRLLSIYF